MKPSSTDTFSPQALQESFREALRPGQLMEALFDCVPGAFFFVKDRESRFMAGGRSFAQTLGEGSIEAMIGKTDYDYSPDFLADGFYADDQRVIRTGQAIYNNIELVPSADGSLDWLCTTKVPLFDNEGAVVGLAGVARIIRDSDAVYSEHPEMHRIVDYVRAHYREKLSVGDMAKVGEISVSSHVNLHLTCVRSKELARALLRRSSNWKLLEKLLNSKHFGAKFPQDCPCFLPCKALVQSL